jgi:OmpA-OmpF porin, OOP family
MQGKKVEIIGHTDNQGLRRSNLVLSQARAESVKAYLAGKGIGTNTLTALGQGPDRPVTTNDSAEGRARNRRIEFRVSQ